MRGNILLSLLIVLFLGASAFLLGNAGQTVVASSEEHQKVNVCHEKGNGDYQAIQVDDDGDLQGHSNHENDFPYDGPVDDKGKPEKKDKEGDKWCEDNVPAEPFCLDGEDIDVPINEEAPEDAEEGRCPEPEPQEQPKLSEASSQNAPPASPPPVNECAEGEQAPATPVVTGVGRLDADSVYVNWAKADGVNHYVLSFGRSYDSLDYGLASIPGDSQGVTLDSVWGDGHVFGKLTAEADNNCQSSVFFDP